MALNTTTPIKNETNNSKLPKYDIFPDLSDIVALMT